MTNNKKLKHNCNEYVIVTSTVVIINTSTNVAKYDLSSFYLIKGT